MLANRQTLVAGVETEFTFAEYNSSFVMVKNETLGAILFCDGIFDADKAASIPAFSCQVFNIIVKIGELPKFTVKAAVSGAVEIDFGSPYMGSLYFLALDAAGMIPHTLILTAGADTTLTVSLIRLHGETLDLDTPVSLTSGDTVFVGDIITFDAAAIEAGYHPVLTVNGEEVELTEGAASITVSGETTAATEAVEDE